MIVEESVPLRADEFDPVRVFKFGPTDADEEVVQDAAELKHVAPPIFAFQSWSGITQRFTFAIPKLVLCVCPWPRTDIGSSQS